MSQVNMANAVHRKLAQMLFSKQELDQFSNLMPAYGVAAVTGSLDVSTGLKTVVAVVACLADNSSLTNGITVTATIGDQAGTPAAGRVTVKVWKPTASGDVTPVASAAAVNINWIALGVPF